MARQRDGFVPIGDLALDLPGVTVPARLRPHSPRAHRQAQKPYRVHTTPISLGIPTRRRYGIRP